MPTYPNSPYSYFSYGIALTSFVPLPDLIEVHETRDLAIIAGNVRGHSIFSDFPSDDIVYRPEISLSVRASAAAICFDWAGLAAALVEPGRVTVELDPRIAPQDFVPFITGPILAAAVHQRGHLVLHASVLVINGKAVIFVGDKGMGKSTLAAHLQSRGHRLMSDDLGPVFRHGGAIFTTPGHPQLRLFPDTVESIGSNPLDLPVVTSGTEKRQFRPRMDFSREAVEVGCVYVLAQSDNIEMESLNSRKAFMELTRNTYLHWYLDAMGGTELHFKQCRELTNSIPVFRLGRPRSYAEMDNVMNAIEVHTQELFV